MKIDISHTKIKKEIKDFLDVLNNVTNPALAQQGFKYTPINVREGLANLTKAYTKSFVGIQKVMDEVLDCGKDYHVPIRIFHPQPMEKLPVLIFYHGGGGMAGSVTVYDPIYRRLAKHTNHIVVAPEYRLAPENRYPQGAIDAYNTLLHIEEKLQEIGVNYTPKFSVGGDSAGGFLSAYVTQRAYREKKNSIYKQILIYPGLDLTMSLPSWEENKENYLLSAEKVKWYYDNFIEPEEDPVAVSPLFGDLGKELPPTVIFSAQYCPLRDENRAYGEKLKKAGVEVEYYNLENMIHTFLNMEELAKEECNFVYEKCNKFLNR